MSSSCRRPTSGAPRVADVDAEARPRLERLPDRHRLRLALRLDRLAPRGTRSRRPSRGTSPRRRGSPFDRRGGLQADGRVDDVAGGHALALARPRAERDERLAGVDGDPHVEAAGRRSFSAIPSRIASAARTARSGSSSCATGAPKSAMTASPMNFSTVPPKRSSSLRSRAWYGDEHGAHVLGIEPLARAR